MVKRVLQEAGFETARSYPPVPAATVERIETLVREGFWPDEIAKELTREGIPVVTAKRRELT